jgi:hypothetical protein
MTLAIKISNEETEGGKIAEYQLGDNTPINLEPGQSALVFIHSGASLTVREPTKNEADHG